MAKLSSAQSIQRTLTRLLGYAQGQVRRGEDLSAWGTPGRMDFLVQSLITESGGSGKVSEGYVKATAEKFGLGWSPSLKDLLSTRLQQHGVEMTSEAYTPRDYSPKTREEMGLKGARVVRTPGKRW